MTADRNRKLETRTPVEWAAQLPLGAESVAIAAAADSVASLVRTLVARGQGAAAVTLLAHALPKRESVWWACLAARRTAAYFQAPAMGAAVEAAEAWVQQPNEATRRLAGMAAMASGTGNPAGLAAQGAFWSGGSLAPDSVPAVPPGETLTARAVQGAIKLALAKPGPLPREDRLGPLVEMALDLAGGGDGRGITFGVVR